MGGQDFARNGAQRHFGDALVISLNIILTDLFLRQNSKLLLRFLCFKRFCHHEVNHLFLTDFAILLSNSIVTICHCSP